MQRMLRTNKRLLRRNGYLYPGDSVNAHFVASLDLRGVDFHGHTYPDSEGAWARIVREVDGFRGTSLISHETLTRSPEPVIRKAVESFATDDVRVVITARDLARQVPAVWQERLKHAHQETYAEFLASQFESAAGRRRRNGFWGGQHLLNVTRRWAGVVGPDRMTVVTVPPSGADPQELWCRFAAAVGLPELSYDFDIGPANPSLGVVEAELLRRLNAHLQELPWPQYERLIKGRFAERRLAPVTSSDRLSVPERYREEIETVSRRAIGYLQSSGCRIVGDLQDLEPRWGDRPASLPEVVETEPMLEVALKLLADYAAEPPAVVRPQVPPRQRFRTKVREVLTRG